MFNGAASFGYHSSVHTHCMICHAVLYTTSRALAAWRVLEYFSTVQY